jgi:hypothetical protein
MVILHGTEMGLATNLRLVACPLTGISVVLGVIHVKSIFKSIFIVIVVLPPAMDQGKRVSSKILSRI